MIQRRHIPETVSTDTCLLPRSGPVNIKVAIKEKKAARRKEKSRVAAQIRRNKESQTLILLQNALPLALPSPSQMLEKSIVIRIAGQTLFLLNTLDQVLGMNGWLTIPLINKNFLTFFVDGGGQIVYASPNIQLLMEQYHWSNLIGMSIYDVVNFKSRWPSDGEVVSLQLPTNPTMSTNQDCVHLWSPSNDPQSSNSRATIPSKLNPKRNLQSPTSRPLYHVWCCNRISHTDSKLKLLILQTSNISRDNLQMLKPLIPCSSPKLALQRSISCPTMSSSGVFEHQRSTNSVQIIFGDEEPRSENSKCIYQRMMTSALDRDFNFISASMEFIRLIGDAPKTLANSNFLDIIHLEDVIEMKIFFEHIVEHRDGHVWSPVYRIMCHTGRICVLKTLAKHLCTNSCDSLMLSHILVESSQMPPLLTTSSTHQLSIDGTIQDRQISRTNVIRNTNHDELIPANTDYEKVFLTKKFDEKSRTSYQDKYVKIVNRMMSGPLENRDSFLDTNQPIISLSNLPMYPSSDEGHLPNDMLCNDPFVPMGSERGVPSNRKPRTYFPNSAEIGQSTIVNMTRRKTEKRSHRKSEHSSTRSPSYSLESCVLTSPGSESTDIPIEDKFVWESGEGFADIGQLNCWLDEQFTAELDLILPI